MSTPATPIEQQPEKKRKEPEQPEQPQKPQEQQDEETQASEPALHQGESDSDEDPFAYYKSDAEDAQAPLPEGALPVVRSYQLDLPKGKRARAQFDAEVNALVSRICRSKK
jgi:hypothetical protein